MEKMVRSYDDKGCWRYTGNGMSYLSLYVFNNSGYLSISDIDIEPGVKEARFICPDGETAVVFFLEKCMKQFPDIEKIYIGSGVKSLLFSNFMFPNVKYVESDSKSFLSGQMLVSRDGSLYNVFCRKPEDVIDLNKVIFIEDKAFAGCMSTNIINTDNVSLVDSMAFDGSAVSMADFEDGVVMVGDNIIIDVNEDADEIVLPRNCVVSHAIEKRHLKKAVIKDMKMLSGLQLNADTIVIDDDNERDMESLAKYGLTYAKTIELTEKTRSLGYIDVDGIVYSADRKTLLVCPGRRTKPVNIPEGTEVISAFAFADSMIESVSMLDYSGDDTPSVSHGTRWCNNAGIGILIHDADGYAVAVQIRRDTASKGNRYCWFTSIFAVDSIDYDGGSTPGAAKDIIIPENPRGCLCITEGRFKSEILAANRNITISIQGVSSWKGIDEIINKLREQHEIKSIYLMFDSDILGNRQVFNTISEMARMLMEKVPDLKIKFAIWKIGYGKGIDDCILAGNIREVRYIDAISFMNTCNEAFDMLLKKYEVKSFKKMKSEDRKVFAKHLQAENERRLFGEKAGNKPEEAA